jgi:hypothetical protein
MRFALLRGETLALNIVLVTILRRMAQSGDATLRRAIVEGLNEAADIAEHTAITMGKKASPEHTV